MSDISAFVRRTKSADRDDINKLLGLITPIAFGLPEIGGVKERLELGRNTRLRTLSATTAILDIEENESRDRYNGIHMRLPPASVSSYGLIHSTTNSFIPIKTTLTKFGAGLHNGGSAYITVEDHSILDLTTEVSIDCWIYPQTSSGNGIIVEKDGSYSLRIVDTNTIEFFVNSKTALTYDYTSDINTWIHVVATYKSSSSGQKLYINNSLVDSDSESGSINVNTNDLYIFGNGTSDLPSGFGISYLTILSTEADTTWVDNSYNGLHDFSAHDEVTSIPMRGNEEPEPNATSNFFKSST